MRFKARVPLLVINMIMKESFLPVVFLLLLLLLCSYKTCASSLFPEFTESDLDEIINDAVKDHPDYLKLRVTSSGDELDDPDDSSFSHESFIDNLSVSNETKSSENSLNFRECLAEIKKDLFKKLKEQHPLVPSLRLRNYRIQNWPVEVDQYSNYWPKKEIKLIRERLNDLVFTVHEGKISIEEECGITKHPEIEFVIDPNMTKSQTFADLLHRFRIESGFQEAKCIDWKMLDSSQIPEKYDAIEIKGKLMWITKFHKNPEIVNNMHFYKYTEEELAKFRKGLLARKEKQRKSITKTEIGPKQVKLNVLTQFRRETRNSEAQAINWKCIDLEKLPEKYRTLKLTNRVVFETQKLYKEADFIQNVRFKEYTEKHLNRLAKERALKRRKRFAAIFDDYEDIQESNLEKSDLGQSDLDKSDLISVP